MREDELLGHIAARSADLSARYTRVVVGPGDDAAVVRTPGGGELLITTDQLIGGRHFTPDTPIDLIARKAVARSVSDIAAMGGAPVWALATAVLPDGYAHADALFDAMAKWARHWNCPLVGGDIAGSPGPLALSVTVAGEMPDGVSPILRSGARAGDAIGVTGPLGGSLASGRHLTFEPRLDAAALLASRRGDVRAAMDLSDGLGIDADRMARASGVVIEIEAGAIPLAHPPSQPGLSWLDACRDGEDYELLVAFAPGVRMEGITIVGACRARRADEPAHASIVDPGGARHAGGSLGWDHQRHGRPRDR